MFKFIDLFAGIGGFHHALHELGGECVFASEIDEFARRTYIHNLKRLSPALFETHHFNDDIRKISPAEIPDFDILCAGFPCQPFSQAGYKQGFTDGRNSERGNLFFNIAEIIDVKRPKAFFLENVRGIINHDGGKTFSVIRRILEDEFGYSFYHKVVYASDYGLPQHRPRAFIIGFRDEGFLKGFRFPEKIPLKFNMSDVFGATCSREIGYTLRVGGAGSNIDDRRNWDSYLVDGKVVRIQPEHGIKMQGFPSDFEFPVRKKEAMKQLGNSVAIDAVRACASSLIDYIEFLETRSENTKMASTKNKGEWTELYSFLKIINEQKILLSDANLNMKNPNDFIRVTGISTLNIREKLLLLGDNTIGICKGDNSALQQIEMPIELTQDLLIEISNKIKNGTGTFAVDEFKILADVFGIAIVKGGNSNQKADIVLDYEYCNAHFADHGFGIKSYLGSKPTLLNASGNTNFLFQVNGFADDLMPEVNSIDTNSKLKDRINYIYKSGGSFEYVGMEAPTMEYNLKLVDSSLPKIISRMLLNFYLNRINRLDENIANVMQAGELEDLELPDLAAAEVKIKRMLVSILLGFFAGTKWDGNYVSKGTIVVKEDASQVVFHVAEITDLEEYLFRNIKFDTPSTTRHRYGSVFKERDGKLYFKLNMQLRF